LNRAYTKKRNVLISNPDMIDDAIRDDLGWYSEGAVMVNGKPMF